MLGPFVVTLKHADVHFGKLALVNANWAGGVQVWRHSDFPSLVLSFLAVHHFTLVSSLDEEVHLLTCEEVHDFEVRVKWSDHGVDLRFVATSSAEEAVRLASHRVAHDGGALARADGALVVADTTHSLTIYFTHCDQPLASWLAYYCLL